MSTQWPWQWPWHWRSTWHQTKFIGVSIAYLCTVPSSFLCHLFYRVADAIAYLNVAIYGRPILFIIYTQLYYVFCQLWKNKICMIVCFLCIIRPTIITPTTAWNAGKRSLTPVMFSGYLNISDSTGRYVLQRCAKTNLFEGWLDWGWQNKSES